MRSPFLSLLLAGGVVAGLAGCSAQPENSPAIRKKFAEYDQVSKSVDKMSADVQALTEQVRRLSEENSELRALAPDADGVGAIEKISSLESRLQKMEKLAGEKVIAAASNTTPRTTPKIEKGASADLAMADLATGTTPATTTSPEAVPAVKTSEKVSIKPVAEKKVAEKKVTEKKATPKKATVKPVSRGGRYHAIAAGETIESLAAKFKVSPETLAKANNLPKGAKLSKGQSLYIPGN